MPPLALTAPHSSGILASIRRYLPFLRPRHNGRDAQAHSPSAAVLETSSSSQAEWIARAAAVCEAAARGDLEGRILRCHEVGELGRLMHAINNMLDSTEAFVREAGAPLESANLGRFYRRVVLRGMHGSFRRTAELINCAAQEMARDHAALLESTQNRRALADQFDASVKKVVSALVTSAARANDAVQELAAAAGSTGTAHSVASSPESSPEPPAKPAPHSDPQAKASAPGAPGARVASASASASRELGTVVGELVEASQRIGGVVKLISQIAAQTNLLALNATIEAARAGEVGRGFGVVANEVKSLSQQTAKATDQIRREITDVRVTAQSTAELVGSMGQRISELREISSHVSEQAAELSSSVDNFLRTIRA